MKNTPKIPTIPSWPQKDEKIPWVDPSGGKEDLNKPTGKCPKCDITLFGVMGYYCDRDACPVFQRPGALKTFMCGGK